MAENRLNAPLQYHNLMILYKSEVINYSKGEHMKRKIVLMLLALALVVTACGSSKEKPSTKAEAPTTAAETSESVATQTETEKTEPTTGALKDPLIMGLDDTFAPMGFRDASGELVGFDIDLSREIAKKIGVTIEYQPIDWSMKETELNAGNIDLIWNGYSVTDERKEKVTFSDPYLENSQVIVTMAGSPIKTKADLAGKAVVVQAMSSSIDAVKKEEGVMESFKGGAMIEYPTFDEAFADLESGRSDALVVDETNARYYMGQKGEEKYAVLEDNFGEEVFGIGMRKEDKALVDAVNKALKDLKEDGTYKTIYSKWFADN